MYARRVTDADWHKVRPPLSIEGSARIEELLRAREKEPESDQVKKPGKRKMRAREGRALTLRKQKLSSMAANLLNEDNIWRKQHKSWHFYVLCQDIVRLGHLRCQRSVRPSSWNQHVFFFEISVS